MDVPRPAQGIEMKVRLCFDRHLQSSAPTRLRLHSTCYLNLLTLMSLMFLTGCESQCRYDWETGSSSNPWPGILGFLVVTYTLTSGPLKDWANESPGIAFVAWLVGCVFFASMGKC